MWEQLSSNIVTIIQNSGISDIKSTNVFGYPKSRFDGYPAITVYPSANVDPSFADTQRNRRTYVFSIRVYQERGERGESESERIMRGLIDSLIALFDANPYLSTGGDADPGGVLEGIGFCRPIPSQWAFIQGEQTDTRMAEILLECVVIQ